MRSHAAKDRNGSCRSRYAAPRQTRLFPPLRVTLDESVILNKVEYLPENDARRFG